MHCGVPNDGSMVGKRVCASWNPTSFQSHFVKAQVKHPGLVAQNEAEHPEKS